MKNKNDRILILLTTLFGSLTLVFLCLFLSFLITSNTYKTQLENSYMKSFYEMVDNINTLEVDLSKIVATNDLSSQRVLLDDIYNNCMMGVSNLNVLPISNEKMANINTLLNKTGGFAYSLLQSNFDGVLISNNDYNQINTLYNSVRSLQYDINEYMRQLQYDYSILKDVDFGHEENSSFSGGFVDTESSNSDVPSLIYDGPFSDSVLNKDIVGLPNTICTLEQVTNNLKTVFPNFEIKYTGETIGKFETYNFELNGDIDLYVGVTKQGGFLLTMTSYSSGNGEGVSKEKGMDIAEGFAKDIGTNDMYTVWSQQSGNILYVNLAPIVDHVIYYSDLIKVKVDLSLGKVVGWEAVNYATNHVSRTFNSSIGILDAQTKVSKNLKVVERNLCIIPDEFVSEMSAYEFICTWEDYTYYVYIDSNTGEELNILRVIDTSNGQLLM